MILKDIASSEEAVNVHWKFGITYANCSIRETSMMYLYVFLERAHCCQVDQISGGRDRRCSSCLLHSLLAQQPQLLL